MSRFYTLAPMAQPYGEQQPEFTRSTANMSEEGFFPPKHQDLNYLFYNIKYILLVRAPPCVIMF
jgi:hypothetical protein